MATEVIIVPTLLDLVDRLRHELKDSKSIGITFLKDDGTIQTRAVRKAAYKPKPGTKKRAKSDGFVGLISVRDMTKANAIYSAFKSYKCGIEMTPFQEEVLKRCRIKFHEGMTMDELKEIVPTKTWTTIKTHNLLSVTAEGVKYSL